MAPDPKLVPITPVSLLDNKESLLPDTDTNFSRNQLYNTDASPELKDDIGNVIFSNTDTQKKRADSQSALTQAGYTIGRVLTDVLGGTIQGIGATGELPVAAYDEIKNQDADFDNGLMQLGRDIEEWGKDKLPLYKQNPGKSWDVKDPAWWFEGIESAASTLQFLIPVGGATKGVGAIARLAKAEEFLGTLGANVEKVKYFSKIGVGSIVARNAENMMESYQVRQTVKENLLDEWTKDPNTFEKLKDSEVGKELQAEGREINQENLSNFIAGKAGWKDYYINSANIAFDALQLAPLFKGFDPGTRKGFLSTPSAVREAQEAILKKGVKSSIMSKVGDYLNPVISGVGRSLSEGLEEVVNDLGSEEGKNSADQLTGKDNSNFTDRLSKFLTTGSTYESAFWGTLGGGLFEGASHLGNKAFDLSKGIKGNTESDYRILEINNRANIIKEGAEKISDITKDVSISEDDKKEYINRVKADLSLDLGLRAAQTGNIEMLLQQIKSPEFRKDLIEKEIATEEDVDKAITNTTNDVILAEDLYKKYYNSFYTSSANDQVKNLLINSSITSEYLIQKNKQRTNELQLEISKLKSEDLYLQSTQEPNVETAIETKALQIAKNSLEDYLDQIKVSKEQILTERGNFELNKINEKIKNNKELMSDLIPTLEGLNPDIISKQAETILSEGINNLNQERINTYRKKETAQELNKEFQEAKKKSEKDSIDSFKVNLDSEIKEGKHSLESLLLLKKDNKSNKSKSSYIDSKINDFKSNIDQKTRNEEIKTAQDLVTKNEQVKPVIVDDVYSHIPEFSYSDIDSSTLNPAYKNVIDGLAITKDLDQMQGFVGDSFFSTNPMESLYARNKFQELRNELASAKEISNLNKPAETGRSIELEFDEEAQINNSSSEITLSNITGEKEDIRKGIKDTSTRLDFFKKIQNQPSVRSYIPAFSNFTKGYNSNHYFTTKNGNIIINDDFKSTFKTLFGKDLQAETEIDVEVDIKNPYYNNTKTDIDNVPIKFSYKGVTLSYLSTVKALEYNIKDLAGTEKGNELALELPRVKSIREKFKSQEGHNNKIFKTKVVYKGNGTVVSRGRNKQTSLRSVKGIIKDFYSLNPASSLDTRTVYNISNNDDFFGSSKQLKQGTIYGMIESANGTKIPIPLFVSKIDSVSAAQLQTDIDQLMTSLENGLTTEHQEVKNLKDSIAKYIKVDRSSQYDKPVGFRIYPKGTNENGELTKARIEMSFFNSKGERRIAVIRKNDLGFTSFSVVRKDENGKDIWSTNKDGSFYTQDVLDPDFSDVLKLKYNNIDFNQLKAKSQFTINNKVYKSYKDYIIDEEIIKTDIAQVLDSDGNVLSNLYGFNNDFSLDISSNLYEEGQKEKIDKIKDSLSDLLMTSSYEKEFSSKDVRTNELDYRKNYSIYEKSEVSANTIIKEILNNPLNSNIKEVAKWLDSNLNKIHISITKGDLGYGEDTSVSAIYKSLENKIIINSRYRPSESLFQQTILHELIHGVTVSTIFNNVTLDGNSDKDYITSLDQIKFKKYCPNYVKEFVTDISLIRDNIASKLSKKYGTTIDNLLTESLDRFYGLESVQEFISEVMTNPNFRNEIRSVSDNNILKRIYNKIVEFLNNIFGTKLSIDSTLLKEATDKIKNFVDSTKTIEPARDFDVVFSKKLQDKFNNEFNRDEINEITNTVEGVILNIVKNKKIDLQESFQDLEYNDRSSIKDLVSSTLSNYRDNLCPESCRTKVNKVLEYDMVFIDEAMNRINKSFKISSSFDIENIQDTQEVTKEWNDLAAQQVSSQDTITNQIKMFVKMTPDLSSLNTKYTEDGKVIWDRKKSTTTGMNKYVDFNTIHPYMVRNLVGSKSPSDILERLNKMSKLYPSFAYMADQLTQDSNLLAQIESNMGRKYTYDSYVTFLSAYDEGLVVRIDNEAKNTKNDILLANQWTSNINRIIDSLDSEKKKFDYNDKISKQFMKIVQLRDGFENHIEAITNHTFDFANELGVNLSLSSIEAQLKSARNWNDFRILQSLQNIFESIRREKKSYSYGNLNYLANIESIFTFDIVENSVLSIEGKPLYTIRNPHFVSNWFSLAKSETAEGKQEFEELLRNYAKSPDMELSSWLWNNSNKPGFLNYEIKNGSKVITNVNWDFVSRFNFHNFGGAKETTTREAQQYSDFSEKDWMMINLLNHIQGSKKKGFIQVPGLIPSDSGSMYTLEVPKIGLNKDDYFNNRLDNKSNLFKAVYNTSVQEIKRIQQATSQVFNIIDNKLVPKEDLDINSLQQYFHYGKSLIYNEDGTINIHNSLLDEKGKPRGKAFSFQNISIKQGDKVTTINDIDGVFINYHLGIGEVSTSVTDKIKSFTDTFINQQISKSISDYSLLESIVEGKHDSIGDGSFNHLIVEYTLNQYIANVEQFNLFNGVIAEYKDKVDTNKRAKQMFAPGIGLSIEAMKIKLQNGSFTDGRTFKAVTIKDINTTSNTIDFIINSVKDQIIKEKKYTNTEIKEFNKENLIKGKPQSKLEKDIYSIIKGYLKITAGDAQGYITLDRYESILRGLGRWSDQFQNTFDSIRNGKQITSEQIKTLQPLKGFYYGREYDSTLNRFSSNQIKYSTIPLIPQLVKGSDMEKLMDKMNKDSIDEIFFESAHKVGAKRIYNINSSDYRIDNNLLNDIKPTTYYNKNWQLQLDVPEHLVDSENLLATQIAKLVIANIDDTNSYNINGKTLNGKHLKEHYFDILNQNIVDSANNLLKNLGVTKNDNGFTLNNKDIYDALIDEINKRGLSENYRTAIQLNDRGEFNLPLFSNNMSYKWEAILTSLFTNRIINQKVPGSSVVLASRLFLDNSVEQSNYETTGIEWSKDKIDKTLKSYRDESGIQVVEVLLGAWSSKLYKDGNRISIDEIPDEVKTMIGYRIPTERKSSMFVFKVVGFLPEESKGTIITPDDLINQSGWDFDVDKVFTMIKDFYITDSNKFVIPKIGQEEQEFKDLLEERKNLLGEKYQFEETNLTLELTSDIAEGEINQRLSTIKNRLKEIGEDLDGKFQPVISPSRSARNNEIFDIYHSILTNKAHLKETFTPSGFDGLINVADEINSIFGQGDNTINPMTEEGQRIFRKRNISGRALKGIAANFNAFGAVAQHTKMSLNNDISFKFKFDLLDTTYNRDEIKKRYKEDVEFKDNHAIVTFKNLGFAPDGSYLNVEGDLILEKGAQGIAAAVDIVKNPTFDAFNATTYTYPAFHTMLLAGVPDRIAAMFIRQPIIKKLNDYYFDNKSLLGDNTGNQIETIKRFYQTHLYTTLVKGDKNKKIIKLQKTLAKREKVGVNIDTLDKKFLVYIKREDTKSVLGYDPDNLHVFSVEELKKQLEISSKGLKLLNNEERVDFYTKQLMILEYFNKYKKAGEGTQDVLKITKVDGLGAGPTMMVTNELNKKIESLKLNNRVLIDGIPAAEKIYPSDDKDSIYSPLETYLEYGNNLSVDVLKSLFIQQSNSFKDILSNVKFELNKTLDEDSIKNINKFLGTNLIQDFNRFKKLNKENILGINKEVNNNTNISFSDFKNLSVANKVVIMQQKNVEYLKENSQHILNFLTTELDKDKIVLNGYHKLNIIFYKNEFTDDNLADSLLKMYDSGNDFEKDLVEDLINYSFVANGLTFGLNSFAKVIPNELLTTWGLGDFLYEQQQLSNKGFIFTGKNTVDLFLRNSWNDPNIVPLVKTRWQYTNVEGKKVIAVDEDQSEMTLNDSPNWETNRGIVAVTEKRFKTLNSVIKNSPYLLVYNKKGNKLFKKFKVENEGESDFDMVTTDTFNGMTFYYQVDRLGKDSITEFNTSTIFTDNKSSFEENKLVSELQELVNKMNSKKISENLEIDNVEDSDIDDKINECKY